MCLSTFRSFKHSFCNIRSRRPCHWLSKLKQGGYKASMYKAKTSKIPSISSNLDQKEWNSYIQFLDMRKRRRILCQSLHWVTLPISSLRELSQVKTFEISFYSWENKDSGKLNNLPRHIRGRVRLKLRQSGPKPYMALRQPVGLQQGKPLGLRAVSVLDRHALH